MSSPPSFHGNEHGFRSPDYSVQPNHQGSAAVAKAKSEKLDQTMPKNFPQPLTCFYWHSYGECTKSDDDCLYAHYPTGIVACAPVSMTHRGEAKAGRSASATIADITRREKELSEWALELRAREDSIIAREKRIQAQPMSAVIDGKNALLASLHKVRQISTSARRTLGRRYNETLSLKMDTSIRNGICNAFDGAIGGVAGLDLELAQIESKVTEQLGTFTVNVKAALTSPERSSPVFNS